MAQDRQNFSSPEQLPHRSACLAMGDVQYGHGRVSPAAVADATGGAAPAGAVCSVHRSPSQYRNCPAFEVSGNQPGAAFGESMPGRQLLPSLGCRRFTKVELDGRVPSGVPRRLHPTFPPSLYDVPVTSVTARPPGLEQESLGVGVDDSTEVGSFARVVCVPARALDVELLPECGLAD
jgi:hypothetical protein